MTLRNFDEFAAGALALPIGPHTYSITVDMETGLLIKRILATGDKTTDPAPDLPALLAKMTEDDLNRRILGDAYQQMLDNRVPYLALELAAETAMIWVNYGLDVAEAYWNAGGRPEAKSPANTAARRAKTSPATGTATPTRKRASTTTTTTSPTKSGTATRASRTRGGRS